MRISLIFCLFVLFGSQDLEAQRNCGSMEHHNHLLQEDPTYYEKMKQIERATRSFIENPNKAVTGIITIPVVVHVVYNNTAENVSDAQINTQMTVLTDDFRRLNGDANNTWPQASDTEIEFCLATVDPNGNITSGVTRTSTSNTSFNLNDQVKFNSSGGKDAWPASDYLNLWVCDLESGYLGYAQFPGGPANTDGVVVDYQAFGTNGSAQAPFNLGRTSTHEVGHWLNLRHIWGDGNCNVDDFVGDTPTSDDANYGCATGHVSCSTTDMVENYMDYSDDACMNLYTSGQKDRMRALFDTGGAKESLLNSAACGTPTPPTCSDGQQNGNETGVDCGGPDCPACPSCNGTEVTMTIILDNYPEETSWNLVDANGNSVASGGPYSGMPGGSTVTETWCLPDGCYDYTISDSYGDGICCSYGNGSYSLVDQNNNTLASGGSFGSSESTNFCLGSTAPTCSDGQQNGNETGVDCGGPDCPPCNSCNGSEVTMTIVFDDYPAETSWDLVDANGNIVATAGPYSGMPAGSTVTETWCLTDGCFDYTIHDSYGDGICCGFGNGSYSLVDENNNVLASGGSFGSTESTNFCIGSTGPTCSDGQQNGNETGVDCGGPDCPPCSGACTYQNINFNNFDSSWGIWNDGGSDCRRSANDAAYAYSGNKCVRLRDNTNTSVMTTDNINLSGYSEVTIDFTYITVSMENGEDFWLQASTDGGASYQTLTTWTRGTDFSNNVREFPSVVITGAFTSNTRFRFRCDASGNNDKVYIDDVDISGCTNTGTKGGNDSELLQVSAEQKLLPVLESIKLYPNPVSQLLNIDIVTSESSDAVINIINPAGQLIKQESINVAKGLNKTRLDISELNSGIYILQIVSNNERLVRKFSVLN